LWEVPDVKTVTADDCQRVRIPSAQPGQVFALEMDAGKVVLTPVEKPEPAATEPRLVETKYGLILSERIPREEILSNLREDRNRDAK
jgi:hypothetical protein